MRATLGQIEAVYWIERLGSFRAAAVQLNLTQPTISLRIKSLEGWLFARQMTAKTVLGARTLVAILGFQEFMNRVDADRIKRLAPDTFEKYLAYAMALGVEQHWAQALARTISMRENCATTKSF